MLALASCLAKDHVVSFFWDNPNILIEAEEKFGESYQNITIIKNIFAATTGKIERIQTMMDYDRIFFLSDGSIPFLFSKKNFVLLQFPVLWRKDLSLVDRVKLIFLSRVIYNSAFVADLNRRFFPKSTVILYPPVTPIPTQGKKTNTILSVGRFTQGLNMKKQEVLISAFQERPSDFDNWKLVLVGSVLPQDKNYLQKLRAMIKSPSIEIVENPSHAKLIQYYNKTKIYWHAAGFGEDVAMHPERAEHFGISIVEAMSAGCVPIVFKGGGPQEIIEENKNGYFFEKIDQLREKTRSLMQDELRWKRVSDAGKETAKKFSPSVFSKKVQALV